MASPRSARPACPAAARRTSPPVSARAGAPKPAEVAYWNLFGGGDGVRMKAMVAAFEKRHPPIDVSSVTLTWGNPYYTKLSLATLGDQPPDVGISHLTRVPTFARAGLLQELERPDLGRHGLTPGRFTRQAWEKAHVDGKLYAIPLDTHPFVLYYNTKICKKAGLLDGDGRLKPVDGRDEFVAALRQVKKAGAVWGAVVPIVADYATPWRFFYTLYSQAGGEVLADNGRKVVLDDDKVARVLGFMRRLTVKEGLMPSNIDYGGAVAQFAGGSAGFFLEGEWEVSTFETSKTPFSMTAFPQLYPKRKVTQADSHSFVLPVKPRPEPAQRDVSLTFVRGLLDQSLTWAKGGHIPAWLPVQNSSGYRHLKPQSNYAGVAAHTVYDPPAWYSGSGSDFETLMGNIVGAVLSGRASPRGAVAQMRSGLERLARTPSPVL